MISAPGNGVVIYADPSYVEAGGALYQHAFTHEDHVRLAASLRGCPHRWLLSYDDHALVRELYANERIETATWKYTINSKADKAGRELLILRGVDLPSRAGMAVAQVSSSPPCWEL